jgi:hypothetical protein
MGIVLPPLSRLISANKVGSAVPSASVMIACGCEWMIASASVRNVVAFRSSVWLVVTAIPAFLSAPMAGCTKGLRPDVIAERERDLLVAKLLAITTIAYASSRSGGTRR